MPQHRLYCCQGNLIVNGITGRHTPEPMDVDSRQTVLLQKLLHKMVETAYTRKFCFWSVRLSWNPLDKYIQMRVVHLAVPQPFGLECLMLLQQFQAEIIKVHGTGFDSFGAVLDQRLLFVFVDVLGNRDPFIGIIDIVPSQGQEFSCPCPGDERKVKEELVLFR